MREKVYINVILIHFSYKVYLLLFQIRKMLIWTQFLENSVRWRDDAMGILLQHPCLTLRDKDARVVRGSIPEKIRRLEKMKAVSYLEFIFTLRLVLKLSF